MHHHSARTNLGNGRSSFICSVHKVAKHTDFPRVLIFYIGPYYKLVQKQRFIYVVVCSSLLLQASSLTYLVLHKDT